MNDLEEFDIEDGVLIKYKGSGGDVVIPKGVTAIEDCAFMWSSRITSVTIPEGVKSIGAYAFERCNRLTRIELPQSLISIGSGAFSKCINLVHFNTPSSLSDANVGYWVFDECDRLADANNGLIIIGDVIYYCSRNAKTVRLPNHVKTIHSYSFQHSRLESVVIPDNVTEIQPYAFFWSIYLKDVILPKHLEVIRQGAFEGCTELQRIVIPEGVTSIEEEAFSLCKRIQELVLPQSVTSIGHKAFEDCLSLREMMIPQSVVTMPNDVFDNGVNLKSIIAPSVSVKNYADKSAKSAAIVGYFENRRLYCDTTIATDYFYAALEHFEEVLPRLLERDCVAGIELYAPRKITSFNFESVFFEPALQANARGCVAFLLEWKKKHLVSGDFWQAMAQELSQDLGCNEKQE